MLDVLSVGNANIDLLINSRSLPIEAKPVIMPGGSAANFAVGSARLGLKTGFLGFIGRDSFGALIINNLKKEGVKPLITKVNDHTGLVIVFTEKTFKRMYPIRGANNQLEGLKLGPYSKLTNHLHLATPPASLLNQLISFNSVSLDPGSTISKLSFNKLKPYLQKVSLLLPNKEEIESITGKGYVEAAELICKSGCKTVAVKLGPKGCYVYSKGSAFHTPSINYPVTDTTGAGDAFNSAFTYGYLKGEALEKCALMGIASSNVCVTKLGAQCGAKLSELNAILKKVYNQEIA